MKIEKVNEHQIRCTLTQKELEKRDLKLSEIAYGNEKVKTLFRDMMRQAAFQYGFEAEDIPLMIEVIPFKEYAVILITKVEDPDELDTRFSKFAPSLQDGDDDSSILDNLYGGASASLSDSADAVLDLFRRIQETGQSGDNADTADSNAEEKLSFDSDLARIYAFTSLSEVTRIAHVLAPVYKGVNTLYKNATRNTYLLVITKSEHTPEEFNKICNILTEYATSGKYKNASTAYLEEHFETVIADKAIQSLSLI